MMMKKKEQNDEVERREGRVRWYDWAESAFRERRSREEKSRGHHEEKG
jgi:hypothetical protein